MYGSLSPSLLPINGSHLEGGTHGELEMRIKYSAHSVLAWNKNSFSKQHHWSYFNAVLGFSSTETLQGLCSIRPPWNILTDFWFKIMSIFTLLCLEIHQKQQKTTTSFFFLIGQICWWQLFQIFEAWKAFIYCLLLKVFLQIIGF